MRDTELRYWKNPSALAVLRRGARDLVAPPAGTVAGLDLLRTIAIALVASGHYYGEYSAALGHELRIGRWPVFYYSWTGVDLFFVLSGYLIGRQLWRELLASGSIDVPRFLLRRGLRIWPFYFAFLASIIVLTRHPAARYLHDALFVSNYLPGTVAGGWSLSVEEQFYVCLPLLLLLLLRAKVPILRQAFVIGALLVVLPGIRWLTLRHYHGEVTAEAFRDAVLMPIQTHADALLGGVLIAWTSVFAPTVLAARPLLRNLVLPACLTVGGFVLRSLNPELFGFSGLAMIFSAAVIFVLRDRSRFSQFAKMRGFHVLSRLSYAMYLNHFGIVLLAGPVFAAMSTSIGVYQAFVLGYIFAGVASVLFAACTFVLIESPFLQLRDRWLAHSRSPMPSTAS